MTMRWRDNGPLVVRSGDRGWVLSIWPRPAVSYVHPITCHRTTAHRWNVLAGFRWVLANRLTD